MEVAKILHMVGGVGETSYALNSTLQKKAMHIAKPIVQQSISQLYCKLQPTESLTIADLGCSCGPTTFITISEIMDEIYEVCHRLSCQVPELTFFLNDLPGNDFNSIFKYLPTYDKMVKKEKGSKYAPYYVVGVPGSFYGRLLPEESIHFVHSSYSLHWLSQVPRGLEDDSGAPVNRGNIYIDDTSPPAVIKSYVAQFKQDFSTFLSLRSKEIVSGGQMVITSLGRSDVDPLGGEVNCLYGLLAKALNSLVSEGVVDKEKVDAFDLPLYAPAIEEVKELVQNEGSFEFYQAKVFELNWDPFDDQMDDFVADSFVSGENAMKTIRAVMEPMLANHFGGAVMDALFSRYAMNVAEHLKKEKTKYVNFTVALTKRG
ncbi:uncharacterized protein A4U43_C05F30320 [Asparagus officinalis]|uniref:Uncharacterized protein n=1 Tax=Asparagus officinalis TaxID=4686 RepID=A0A5P1EVQ0_ASPOF|nr:anthranilate O-methyltransferase 3-like isoform X1 [Asparagus officinalis]ONK70106.1 uncharacterized protein A4U43_C05F30320 [Asparagus officinalis]